MSHTSDPEPPDAPTRPFEAARLNHAYRRPLISYFQRRTGDAAEAEDLTQEVFLRALKAGGGQPIESPNAFVFAIASNLLRDRARRRSARAADRHVSLNQPVDPQDETSTPDIAAEDSSAERVLIERERLKLALAALEELPERTREIFVLFRLERMKQAEIAARLGISVSAVEKHVVRAVAHLARRFR